MLRKGPVIFLALALVLAAVAALGAYRWIQTQAEVAARNRVVLAPVVVAAGELPAGQKLEPSHLAVQRWPLANIPAGHFARPVDLKGRVLRTPLVAGEVLLPSKLAPMGLAGGLSAVVPEGYRALTVRVDEVIGVGGFVQPGDRVDVLCTVATGPFRDDPATRIVLQDVKVLTTGEKVESAHRGKPKKQKVKVVTLQLLPEQGERLALAAQEGKVLLALRNQGDRNTEKTKGVMLTSLMPTLAAPKPKAAPKETAPVRSKDTVEVIKGVQRSLQTPGEPTPTGPASQSPAPAPRQKPQQVAAAGSGLLR